MARQYTPVEMLRELVAFPTVSRDSNLALVDFVCTYLAEHGVEARLVQSDCGQKANLYATVGPNVEGGVVLSGHTDVVPWTGRIGRRIPSRWSRPGESYTAGARVT